ncbi:MAG: hypothetical protein JSU73_04985 [candidate division WOR-3 bacterium]|nr:MAG: hypothetical protein JSU73_04985 [candidate division WOR-3 bacterium]
MLRDVLAVGLAATALAGADIGEFLIDLEVAYAAAEYEQLSPAAASDGRNSLVVWSDMRSGESDIYGARFTPDGTVLDQASIAISVAPGPQTRPAVAYDGTNYLAVWADRRGTDTSDIFAARITSAGRLLDPNGFAVSTAAGFQGYPAVTFDGANYLVVWTDMRSGGADIYGARVTPDGAVVDTAGLALVATDAEQADPAVVFDGANVLLAWADTRDDILGDIYGARVTSEGIVLDSAGFVISAETNWQGSPGIAPGRDEALVVWHDRRVGNDVDVYGSRITRAGEVLEPSGIAISAIANNQWFPQVAFDGTNYLVAWVDAAAHCNIFGGRVGTDGRLLDPHGFPISSGEYEASPAVTFDGTHNAVVWFDQHPGAADYNIYAARVNGDGVVLDPQNIVVSSAAVSQRRPETAFDGTNFLAVWDENCDVGRDIRGVRLTPEGVVLDSLGIRVSLGGGTQSAPAVAYGRNDYLVVWEQGRNRNRDVRAARVTPAGVVLDSVSILISGRTMEQFAPAVASDGNDYLVAWQDWRSGGYDIYCARVSRSGVLLDTAGIGVCTWDGWQISPAVAYGGTSYLVLWQSQTGGGYDLYGARVSSEGVVLDPDGFVVSAAAGGQLDPAAATDGANFMVVWSDARSVDCNVYAARVTGAGAVLDTAGILVYPGAGQQSAPAVEYDGAGFFLVWQDQRSGEQDVYGARVSPAGVVLDTGPVVRQQGNQWAPVLARGPGNRVFLAYQSWAATVNGKTYNAERIWGKMDPSTGVEKGDECAGTNDEPRVPTIVRGALRLGAADGRRNPGAGAELLDIAGRKVMDMKPGPNEVRHVAPGVYFVRGPQTEDGKPRTAVRKVVIQR